MVACMHVRGWMLKFSGGSRSGVAVRSRLRSHTPAVWYYEQWRRTVPLMAPSAADVLVVVRSVHQQDPTSGVKATLRNVKEQQPGWEVGAKEVRIAMQVINEEEAAAALVAMWPSMPDEI
eukprot:2604756-Prymnesium_polylepis.1